MAIGARDFIDKLLVEKYAQEKVDNHDEGALKSHVSADDMMSAMNCSANNFRTMLALNNRLTMVCYGVVAKSAKYVCTEEVAQVYLMIAELSIKPLYPNFANSSIV